MVYKKKKPEHAEAEPAKMQKKAEPNAGKADSRMVNRFAAFQTEDDE
jgi:hypothetical protein